MNDTNKTIVTAAIAAVFGGAGLLGSTAVHADAVMFPQVGRVRYVSTEVKAVKAREAIAEATTHIAAEVPEYRAPSGARVKSPRRDVDVTQRWLLVDGQWYREFSSEVIDKRFAAY